MYVFKYFLVKLFRKYVYANNYLIIINANLGYNFTVKYYFFNTESDTRSLKI